MAAIQNAATPRIEGKTAATAHSVGTITRTLRIEEWAIRVIAAIIPISTLFPYIAVHIIQAEIVGGIVIGEL